MRIWLSAIVALSCEVALLGILGAREYTISHLRDPLPFVSAFVTPTPVACALVFSVILLPVAYGYALIRLRRVRVIRILSETVAALAVTVPALAIVESVPVTMIIGRFRLDAWANPQFRMALLAGMAAAIPLATIIGVTAASIGGSWTKARAQATAIGLPSRTAGALSLHALAVTLSIPLCAALFAATVVLALILFSRGGALAGKGPWLLSALFDLPPLLAMAVPITTSCANAASWLRATRTPGFA